MCLQRLTYFYFLPAACPPEVSEYQSLMVLTALQRFLIALCSCFFLLLVLLVLAVVMTNALPLFSLVGLLVYLLPFFVPFDVDLAFAFALALGAGADELLDAPVSGGGS